MKKIGITDVRISEGIVSCDAVIGRAMLNFKFDVRELETFKKLHNELRNKTNAELKRLLNEK
jgi:hypothetical protein